jgi:hypothetical protein
VCVVFEAKGRKKNRIPKVEQRGNRFTIYTHRHTRSYGKKGDTNLRGTVETGVMGSFEKGSKHYTMDECQQIGIFYQEGNGAQ